LNNSDIERILVTEVGSSSIRSMMCTTDGVTINIISTTIDKNIINPHEESEIVEQQIFHTKQLIDEHAAKNEHYNPTKVFVFGTQAARELALLDSAKSKQFTSKVNILSAKQEALCSFFATPDTGRYTVIDFGSRSIEIISGEKSDIANVSSISIPINTKELSNHIKKQNFSTIQAYKYLIKTLDKYISKLAFNGNLILMGSVFTNLSWVLKNVNNSETKPFSLLAVEGYKWDIAKISHLTNSIILDDMKMKIFKNTIKKAYPKNPEEINKQVYGLLISSIIFKFLNNKSASLSIDSTRHGAAKLIKQNLL